MCFLCHDMWINFSHFLLKKGKGMKHVATGIVTGVKEDSSQFETTFSMASWFSSNAMSSIGWYVDNVASRHMTCDNSLFDSREKGRHERGAR
jgi:hypothetical protein